MTNRIDKVNSLLEHELANIIQREIIFSENVLVTLTGVKASANLIEAKAFISVYPESKADETVRMLQKNIFRIQQEINSRLNMRPIPKIIFVKDEVTAKAERVEAILEMLKKEEKQDTV